MIHTSYGVVIFATLASLLHLINSEALHQGFQADASANFEYIGGCLKAPPAPSNGRIRCNPSGCRATCASEYSFQNNEHLLYIDCKNGEWVERSGLYPTIPDCYAKCDPPCLNKGICVTQSTCKCPVGFVGKRCETEVKTCDKELHTKNQNSLCTLTNCRAACDEGYQLSDGSVKFETVCANGVWVLLNGDPAPDCEPACNPICKHGGTCVSPNVCSCPEGYEGDHCENAICNPPCLNKGVCASPNECNCLIGWKGASCQYDTSVVCKIDDLLVNGQHECTMTDESKDCTVSCIDGMEPSEPFADVYRCKYSEGKFEPETIPSCARKEETLVTAKKGKCFTWSGMNFKTFDGQIYGFTSSCSYILVQDIVDHTFKITLENSADCDYTITEGCSKVIKIYYREREYVLKKIDDTPTLISADKVLDMPVELPGLSIRYSTYFIAIRIDEPLVKIKWDGHSYVKVTVGETLWKKTGGLCGTSDGSINNDMQERNGEVTEDIGSFVKSWQSDSSENQCSQSLVVENQCVGLTKDVQEEAKKFCKELLGDSRFASCVEKVNVDRFLDSCMWSYCACKKDNLKECACETVNIYARECIDNGATDLTDWRKQFCPMKCYDGKVYATCAPKGATCGAEQESETCEEGCYCPEGMMLHNDKCIAKKDCPCQNRGKEMTSGSTITRSCNTCTCKEGEWNCTKNECKSRCSSVGDPHYKTFDGKRYDFMGHCKYYLVKHANFSIIAENVPCTGTVEEMANLQSSSELPSCTKAAVVQYGGHTIQLNQNLEVIVDEKYITRLPFTIDGIAIRTASSTFIIVELPNNVQVTWDGNSRLFVDGSASLYGETRGLCGTFNNNKDDDFLTPDGTIEENEVRFGNSWKTDSSCGDAKENIAHPCLRNPKKKAAAQKNCNVIKSEIFADCHWEVDPTVFYQECLFDVCSCELKLPRCFCPMIGAYATECARNGVFVEWRSKVRGCGVQCKGGQTYQPCGNVCARTCSQIAEAESCEPTCVEGCNCPEGQALNRYMTCVPIETCECEMDGVKYPAGHNEIRNVKNAMFSCTCRNATWDCEPFTPSRTVSLDISMKDVCLAQDKKYTLCAPVNPATCKTMHDKVALPPKENCREGCVCPDHHVLSDDGKTCIEPKDCPCFYGGRSYQESEVIKENCNNCTCKNGKWICTEIKCPGLCSFWGNSHFKTFDGEEFDYQGQCDYVLTMGDLERLGGFQVAIQNDRCGSSVSCLKSATISVHGTVNESVRLTKGWRMPNVSSNKRILVRELSHHVIVDIPEFDVTVTWDKENRLYVTLSTMMHDKVRGLCGNYNGFSKDDFQTPSGELETSAELFGDSWALQPQCPTTEKVEDTCENKSLRKKWANKKCNILNFAPFSDCHTEVPVAPFIEKCIFDACGCDEGGDEKCVCTALAAYAYECNKNGVPIRWRSPKLCPMQCDSTCSHYDPCISTCVATTTENTCSDEICLEGCIAKECPKTALTRSPCMVIDGKLYYEGDLIEEDECRSCHCWNGKKQCQCTAGLKM